MVRVKPVRRENYHLNVFRAPGQVSVIVPRNPPPTPVQQAPAPEPVEEVKESAPSPISKFLDSVTGSHE